MNNEITKENIIESWNNGWSEEFHKQLSKKTIKSTFNIIFLESAKSFSKRTSNTLNNPFTKFIKTYFEGTVKFKNKIIKILGISIDGYLDENILLALGETKEEVNQILGSNNEGKKEKIDNNLSPTKDELIESWNNGWAEECLKTINEGNSFHKAFLNSAKRLYGENHKKLNDFSKKYDMCYSLYAFAHAISKILTINNNSIRIELLLKELFGNSYDQKMILFQLALSSNRSKINEKINAQNRIY